jgi:cysteinyl-tRNA synthetase
MHLLSLIGNTPIVPLRRLASPEGGAIYAKLEAMNPGGSVKDRPALNMIEAGEESGLLTSDKIVLEATSGNTGIGLAMVCAAKGYRCCLVMPESASMERRQIMRAYGAELILTPARRSTDGAIEKAYALALEQPELYFLTDQFNNPANWQAHCKSTAPEIWRQTEGVVTHIVTTLGTSGTAMGLSRWFREQHPDVRVIAVEPYYRHKIQGLKNMKESYRPEIFDKTLPHQIVNVADEDAFRTARLLAQREGLFGRHEFWRGDVCSHGAGGQGQEQLCGGDFPGRRRTLSEHDALCPQGEGGKPGGKNPLSQLNEPQEGDLQTSGCQGRYLLRLRSHCLRAAELGALPPLSDG